MTDFTNISGKYEADSVVQKSAGEVLLELARVGSDERVLDLGCGTGHFSRMIRERTGAEVIGIDPAPGMIETARAKYGGTGLSFRCLAAARLDYRQEFDLVFCNSAFQWFSDPDDILRRCRRALKPGGRMAVQAPATRIYSPTFLEAIAAVRAHPATRDIFGGFRSPWFFLESAGDYRELFESAGLSVSHAELVEVGTEHSPEEVFKIFESGAAAGYLNQRCYSRELTSEYRQAFRAIVQENFTRQAGSEMMVRLVFRRIYLRAETGRTGSA